jgi:hypothetical protein
MHFKNATDHPLLSPVINYNSADAPFAEWEIMRPVGRFTTFTEWDFEPG